MKALLWLIGLLLVSGCASIPDAPRDGGATAYLVRSEPVDPVSRAVLDFVRFDATTTPSIRQLPDGTKVRPVQPGRHTVGIYVKRLKNVGFMEQGMPLEGRALVEVDLRADQRYSVKADYRYGELSYRCTIVDAQTGEPASSEFDVELRARAGDWTTLMIVPLILSVR